LTAIWKCQIKNAESIKNVLTLHRIAVTDIASFVQMMQTVQRHPPYCRAGKCVDCPEAKKAYGKCVSCPALKGYDMGITEVSCHNGCGENYIFSSSGQGYCLGCKSSYSVTTTLDECRRCPNRYFNESTKNCLLCSKTVSEDGLSCQ
jgi:hypothetical protein